MIWYSYHGLPYKGNCPAFYDLSGKSWFNKLLNSKERISQAALDYLKTEGITVENYFNTELVSGKDSWKISPFLFWGERNEKNIAKAKALFAEFENIPGLVGLALSILPAQTCIKPHYGDTDAIYRIHIPISIPAMLPACGLKVNNESRSWNEDELLAFCDVHMHEAWNLSNRHRIVLIVDIIREEFAGSEKNICLNVRSLLRLQQLAAKHNWINLLPAFVKGILRHLLKTGLQFAPSL